MQASELIAVMEQIAPLRLAETWDNVGLLAGDPRQVVSKVLLTIDYTAAVAEEGRRQGCDFVIAYHPPIFDPLKRVLAGGVVFDAISRGVGIYSPHTALDVAEGGTNDLLADVLGLSERAPLRVAGATSRHYKLVTFVPEQQLETVSQALFDAGAGRIGAYSHCSFRSAGTGTFFGESGSSPAVGQAGRLESAAEVRLETVVPIERVTDVVRALGQAHPYEEPAFDLIQLAAPPEGLGQGRIGAIAPGVGRPELFDRIKRGLTIEHLLIAGPLEGPVARAAVCAGACGDLLDDAIAQKAELYLTGEMRHHDAIKAAAAGMTVVATLHSNSERALLLRLKEQLQRHLLSLDIYLSQSDRDPFSVR